MARLYTKKVWFNDQTKLSAKNLNHIEKGIEAVAETVDELEAISKKVITDDERTKLSGIDAGAQVNKIESIKVNGTEVKPDSNKEVNITVDASGAAENAVSTHNTSSTAHSDIRTLVSNAQTAADNAQTKANEIEELIVNGVIDGSPKGVYADLSALQTAYPSGASGVYLTSDNGHWYYWNGTAWTDGGVYHSSEDVKKIKEDLSDVENILNIEETPSKNLIDKSKIIYDAELVNNVGGIATKSGWYVTDWIPVEPNTKYTVSGISSYYRAETNIDDYQTAVYTGLGQNVATFTTGANTRFVRFNSMTSGYYKPQLELGAYATEYEEYNSKKESVRITNIEKILNDVSKQVNATKFVHISLDDCVFWSDLIDNEQTYTSCFENEKLAKLKEYHEQYGCVFTLNCFIVNGSKSITDVPSKFAKEFRANKDWLKFAFHGTTDAETYENDNVENITIQYNTFVTAIYKMTGDYDCIDRVTRLSSYTGSLNNVLALRDCKCGITGLLTSDANGTSYYLDINQRNYINSHCKIYDADNYITFIRTFQRLQQIINPNILDSLDYANYRPFIELFWHENNNWLDPYWINNFTKPWLEYVKEKGYVYAFPQDLIK